MPANTNRRFFDRDPLTGAVEYFHSNADGTEFVIEKVEDVSPIIEANKRIAAASDTVGWGEGRMVAQMPMEVYWQLKKEGRLDNQQDLAKWINDRDNLAWRVRKV